MIVVRSRNLNRMAAVAMILSMAASMSSFDNVQSASGKYKLNRKKLNISVGNSYVLKLSGKNIQSVKWKNSNKKVAVLKKKGLKKAVVTGKKAGKAKIKAVVKIKNQKKKVLTCNVTVKKGTVDVKKPVISPTPTIAQNTAEPTALPTQNVPVATPTLQPLNTIPENELALCSYPMLFADVPDPYICRKGDTYYMISTTMFLNPGAPIAKSTDLVHWQMVGYVYDLLADDDYGNMDNGKDMYSHGSWAASLEYNDDTGLFYVCFNTHDEGCFLRMENVCV